MYFTVVVNSMYLWAGSSFSMFRIRYLEFSKSFMSHPQRWSVYSWLDNIIVMSNLVIINIKKWPEHLGFVIGCVFFLFCFYLFGFFCFVLFLFLYLLTYSIYSRNALVKPNFLVCSISATRHRQEKKGALWGTCEH